MKILHVETGRHLYGGAQQVIWLVRGLRDRGVDNVLVCPPDSAIDRVARGAGIEVANLACGGDLDLRFAWRLRRLILRLKPDVVHCHSRRGADFPGGQALAGTGVPAVLSRRVDSVEPGWIARLRFRPFKKVITISEHIARVLRATGLPAGKLEVIRSAVDTGSIEMHPDCAAFRDEFDIGPRDFVIAMVAQFIPRKGHRFLFDVIPILREMHPHLRVLLFGRGPGEDEARRLVGALSLDGTVQFAGFRDDLCDFLGCCDLLVHPATQEGLGIAMLEAAAAGLPVLAFATTGAEEAVVNGETGLLVPPGDVASLQAAIAILIEAPDLRRKLGQAGQQRMQDEFTIGKMVERHVELYEAVNDG